MFSSASRRGPSAPPPPATAKVREAARAPVHQPLRRAADNLGPRVSEPAKTTQKPEPKSPTPKLSDGGRLNVGRDICLTGELKSCESLVVEGVVNVKLHSAKSLEVLKDGSFSGSATVDSAEIVGTYEGDLAVSGLLIIHASGRVTGNISTAELLLERGGVICGNLQMGNKVKPKRA